MKETDITTAHPSVVNGHIIIMGHNGLPGMVCSILWWRHAGSQFSGTETDVIYTQEREPTVRRRMKKKNKI